jgi:dipeptidyl aminopeptidase/acylaminoacyl peptidase
MSVTFSPDGKQLAAACPDNSVRLWEVASGKLLHDLGGHRGPVWAVAFTPDDRTVLSGGEDRSVRLWDAETGKEVARLPDSHAGIVVSLQAAPDGTLAYSADTARNVVGWKVKPKQPGETSREMVRRFAGPQQFPFALFAQLALSPDGKMVAAVDGRNPACFWDTATGKELRPLALPPMPFRGIALSPDGHTVALRTQEGFLTLWDLRSGKEGLALGDKKGFGPFAFSPDGRSLVAIDPEVRMVHAHPLANESESLHLWEVATGKERWCAKVPDILSRAVFSPTGRLVSVGGEDGHIRLLDATTGKEIAQLAGHLGSVRALAFSHDGRRLISGSSDTTALLWDVAALEQAARPPALALGADRLRELWDKLLATDAVEAHGAVGTLARAPAEVVPFLKAQVGGLSWPDPKKIPQWIAQLDNDSFDVREAASRELEAVGDAAVPALEKALEKPRSLEMRQRAQILIARLTKSRLPAKKVRVVRALEVLERIGTAEARRAVEDLARKPNTDWLRQEAETTLERWARRPPTGAKDRP